MSHCQGSGCSPWLNAEASQTFIMLRMFVTGAAFQHRGAWLSAEALRNIDRKFVTDAAFHHPLAW